MSFIKNRFLWMGSMAVLVVLLVFGLAMMGSVLTAKPNELPVAMVMLDEGSPTPGGGSLSIGEMMQGMLLANQELPLQWELLSSEEEAREGLSNQVYYGAFIIPSDLSTNLVSLMSPDPQSAEVLLLLNEGKHPQAAATVKQILTAVMNRMNLEIPRQMLGMMGQQVQQLPLHTAEALLQPISVNEETVHPIGDNQANGSSATMMTQIIWLSSMVTAVFLYMTRTSAVSQGLSRWTAVSLQTVSGMLIVCLASAILVWMAGSWYGMEIRETASVWLFLWLAGTAFFLLQSSLLNWLGMPAIGLLVLLLFFSMPVISLAPEFLPDMTKAWLYSWTPLRFAVEGLRDQMYFGQPVTSALAVMWWIAIVSLVVLLSSGVKKAVPSTVAASRSSY